MDVPITFDGSGSLDPDGGSITSYDWDFGDGATGTGVAPSHSFAAAGIYAVRLTVTDDVRRDRYGDDNSDRRCCQPESNGHPNGPYTGTVDVPITFDGSGSLDPDGDSITAYDWDFGDGATGTGVAPSHSFAAAGIYTVRLTVTDDVGATNMATTTATVAAANQNPTADPNGPYTGTVDVPITFDGSGSLDPDGGSITAYDWDFGDGVTGTGVAPSHSFAAAGIYTVRLTVTDDVGATDLATTTATVAIEPHGINCDINGNGRFDWRDTVRFAQGCRTGSANWACDLNDDGLFNWRDTVRYWKGCYAR